jgi:prephenate dehydrogenase
MAEVINAGAVDSASVDIRDVVRDADLVVLCTPLAQMGALAAQLEGLPAPGAVVTDVGSAKTAVIEAVGPFIRGPRLHFVGSHPMAGSENSGVGAAREDLFEGAITVVTPSPKSEPDAVSRTVALWESIGSRVLTMSAECHDALVSRSSHLPHLVAAALAHWILAPGNVPEQRQLCATGFRDTTRVASGSPEMWRDIALANRGPILEAFDRFEAVLREVRQAIKQGDAEALEDFLRVAKERRDEWSLNGSGPAE